MSSQNSQHSSLSFFDDIFFGNETSAPNEQHDDLITSEPEKKGYNTRGKVKVVEHSEPENNAANAKQRLENSRPLLESLDNIFDDIYASFEEENFNFDSLLDDDAQKPDPSINDTPDLPTATEMDDLLSDIEVTMQNQQESLEPKEPINNNTATQPKRHSLRKRNDLQLHPYSVERANYMSLVRTDSRSRTARDRMHAYIDSPQYTQNQEQENDDDPDFVPGQPSIPTQSDSIVQETQESPLDSNTLYLPKRRSKPSSSPLSRARNQSKNNTTSTTPTNTATTPTTATTTNSTNAARNNDGKTKPIIQSLFNEEESTSTSSHYLQTDPISSLPAPVNRKGKHRIIHTYKRRKARKMPKNLVNQSSIFDFDPNPRVPYNPDDEDEDDNDDVGSNFDTNQDTTNQVSNDNDDEEEEEEEEIPHLPKKWPHKRKLIISDSDSDSDSDDDDGDDDVIISTRKDGPGRTKQKKSLLEPNSVALYEDMVASSTQVQEPPKRRYHRQRPDDDIVPVVQDENELGMRENQRVRLNDITTNNRMLKGILPYSFSNAYRSELQEEQQWNQARKNNRVRQKRVEKERQPPVESLHTATDIFSDEEDDENNESTTSQLQQDHSNSDVYTQSLTPDTSLEAVEDNKMTKHFIRGPTRTQTPSRSRKKVSTTKESNRVSSHNHQKRKSTGQTSQKRRRRKIRKTTDDIYIRPSRHYWNDETIDRMFIRQGNQNQHHQQKIISQDDISVGPSAFRPTTTWHKTKITWIHHIEEYLRSEKIDHRSSNHAIRALKEREKRRLSTTQHAHHHPQQQQQQHRQRKEPENITVASVLERVGDLVDADIRTTVGLSNTVYLHHRLLPSLLSEARNQQKYFLRFKSLLQHPIIHNTRLSWQDVVPTQQKMIRGWFWKAFCDITNTFQAQELTTIDPTFYIFVSVCIGRWIPSLKGDSEMAMIKIFNTETRIFVSQICQFIIQNMVSSPFIPWKVVIEAMLFALDWKCRLFNLGADEAIWPLTDLTSNLIQLLVEIGPERLTMESASYVSEAWICLLQIMSISTESDRYRFDEHLFLSQLEKWVDVKASKETWSKSYKTQAMKQWAIAFKYIFDNYML